MRPHRQQPTRFPRPWDSPGKNTGVGCHFLLQCVKVKRENEVLSRVRLLATPWIAAHQAPTSIFHARVKVAQSCLNLRPHGLYSPWNSPGQNTGVLNLSLLQRIFPTQHSNRGLLHCRRILYQLRHEESPSYHGSPNKRAQEAGRGAQGAGVTSGSGNPARRGSGKAITPGFRPPRPAPGEDGLPPMLGPQGLRAPRRRGRTIR